MPGFLAYSSVKSSELQNDFRVWDTNGISAAWESWVLWAVRQITTRKWSVTVGCDSAVHILFDCLMSFSRKLLLGDEFHLSKRAGIVGSGYYALSNIGEASPGHRLSFSHQWNCEGLYRTTFLTSSSLTLSGRTSCQLGPRMDWSSWCYHLVDIAEATSRFS